MYSDQEGLSLIFNVLQPYESAFNNPSTYHLLNSAV